MTSRRQFKRPCAYCGVIPNRITEDHVPPTAILLKPYPRRITVPACLDCNNKFSRELEQDFGVFLSMWIGPEGAERKRLWQGKALPILRSDRRKKAQVIQNTQPVLQRGTGCIPHYVGHGTLVDAGMVRSMIRRLARGLYYHAHGEALGRDTTIAADLVPTPDIDETLLGPNAHEINVGSQFACRHIRASDDLQTSYWVFRFYNGLFATASTGLAATDGEAEARNAERLNGMLILPRD